MKQVIKKLYFAYGSNMSQERLESRVGKVEKIQIIVLPYWKLAFNCGKPDRRFANIVMTGNYQDSVEGVMYELTTRQMKNLDGFEGHPYFYQKLAIPLRDGRTMYAYVSFNPQYIPHPDVKVDAEYTSHLLRGCMENKLYSTLNLLRQYRDEGLVLFP